MSTLDTWMIPRGFRARTGAGGLELERDPALRAARRVRGVLTSIHRDIQAGSRVRVRRIFSHPIELYRLELERSDLRCQRTTLLDADTLETLLEELGEQTIAEQVLFG
jgi:hypothetical protein